MLTSLSTRTGRAEAVGEALGDREAVPAGHDRRVARAAGGVLDRARARRCRSRGRPRRRGRSRVSSAPKRSSTQPEHRLRPGGDVHLAGLLGEDLAGEVGDREPRVGGAEVGGQDDARVLVEGEKHRRAAARRRAAAGLAQEPMTCSCSSRWVIVERARPVRSARSARVAPRRRGSAAAEPRDRGGPALEAGPAAIPGVNQGNLHVNSRRSAVVAQYGSSASSDEELLLDTHTKRLGSRPWEERGSVLTEVSRMPVSRRAAAQRRDRRRRLHRPRSTPARRCSPGARLAGVAASSPERARDAGADASAPSAASRAPRS